MLPWCSAERREARTLIGEDYWSYGLRATTTCSSTFLRYHHEQGLSRRRCTPERAVRPGIDRGGGDLTPVGVGSCDQGLSGYQRAALDQLAAALLKSRSFSDTSGSAAASAGIDSPRESALRTAM